MSERPTALRRPFWRRGLSIVFLLAAVPVLVAAVAYAAPGSLPRATADRPDDATGPQIHVVYAVPLDGEDRHLDDNGTLEGSVSSLQHWLAQETGGKAFRMDTYQGSLDITFARLRKTGAQLASMGVFEIEAELHALGHNAPGKVYAAYYDGVHNWSCGIASWPPAIPGNVVAAFLRGLPNAPVPCASFPFAGATRAAGFWEFVMAHEIVHGLGFVATCAPNFSRTGHVSSPNNDLMWTADVGHADHNPAKLDPGRDDYYGHSNGSCPDLADSPYLTPLHSVSVTVSGAGSVASTPAGIDCPESCSWGFLGSVTLTATPQPGGAFLGWSGACTGTATTCVVAGPESAHASFQPAQPVSVLVSGPGFVLSNPAGIDCPADCSGTFLGSVTLTATPDDGAVFDGWSGACTGRGACVISGAGSATATFRSLPHRRTLTLGLKGRRLTGTMRVPDGYDDCRVRSRVLVDRRGKRGWAIVKRLKTDTSGKFAASLAKGRATYRARAPETTAYGERCLPATSRTVKTR